MKNKGVSMGRTGITQNEVADAARQLQGRGKLPTVDGIRDILGTGSKTTIARYLNEWKATQGERQGKLPSVLLSVVTGLWEQLQALADERVVQEAIAYETDKQAGQVQLSALKNTYQELVRKLHDTEEKLATTQNHQNQTEQQLQTLQQELSRLEAHYEARGQQLADTQADNEKLHQLARHIQSNLEHYQASIQQLHTEHTLTMERQQMASQQDIANLRLQLTTSQEQLQQTRQQAQVQAQTLVQLQHEYQQLIEKNATLEERCEQHEKNALLYQERTRQQQYQLEQLAQDNKKKEQELLEYHTRIAIQSEQIKTLSLNLQQAEDKIDTLRHEKLFLTQEKAEALGRLKQLEIVS
ncbi:MAG: DNA-binding protein [Gammaproteobacteria bacterium]|nr:DNA-binding protein [Gammaproteobacteria bacterium]